MTHPVICTWLNVSEAIMMLKYFLQTAHKKTFYYLEQLILKHKLHSNALNIKEIHGMSSTHH